MLGLGVVAIAVALTAACYTASAVIVLSHGFAENREALSIFGKICAAMIAFPERKMRVAGLCCLAYAFVYLFAIHLVPLP